MQYTDAQRNQTQLDDPSAGIIDYEYNSAGQITKQTNARGQIADYTYYTDGRPLTRTTPEGTETYVYNANKQLESVSNTTTGIGRAYTYDAKGRVATITEIIAGNNFVTTFTYDNLGRAATRTHPSGITETMVYNDYGYLKAISVNGTDIYTITGMNPRGQLTNATYGNNLNTTLGYDVHGFPASSYAEGVQDYRYVFDPVTGNLSQRKNQQKDKFEDFGYDALDRLETVTGPQNLALQYYDNGNIRIKSDVSTTDFTYGYQAGPYALTGITASTDLVPAVLQSASYTSFEKISTLAQGNYTAAFVYNTDNQRAQMTIAQNGTTILNRIYAGSSYMKETKGSTTKEYTYIGGDAYSAPVAAITQNGTTNYFYLLRDYLGNITHVVNAQNLTTQEYSYDACSVKLGFCERSETKAIVELIPISEAVREGRRRNPIDWSYNLAGQPALFADRGFTGHEYLAEFDLYNMNGRLYDPVVGRFLSVDNYVQMPDYTQKICHYNLICFIR